MLNHKLSLQKQPDFLYGYRPSTADVYLFAHLAAIQDVPSTLSHILSDYPFLQDYYQRVMRMYFTPMNPDTPCSDNLFVQKRGLKIELSNQKDCFTTRKTPCTHRMKCLRVDVIPEEEEEESEEKVFGRISSGCSP